MGHRVGPHPTSQTENISQVNAWTDFPGRVNTPPENVETPPEKLETPPEISLIFNIPNYSLNYFTTMKLFLLLKHSFLILINDTN